MELIRYSRKLHIKIKWCHEKACVFTQNGKQYGEINLNKKLYEETVEEICRHSNTLKLQGSFLNMLRVDPKLSSNIHYNWAVNDDLVKFCVKARLNILPTNYTKYIWNRENNPRCGFCGYPTESIAHVLNGCKEFRNFYSRRHDYIVNNIYDVIKDLDNQYEVFNNKCVDTIIPNRRNEIRQIVKRKPDIFRIDRQNMLCEIIEITVCYDLYFSYAYDKKLNDYTTLKSCLNNCGYSTNIVVLCFGSLGSIEVNCYKNLKHIITEKWKLKKLLKWSSISTIIGSNYVWRHRVRKLLT